MKMLTNKELTTSTKESLIVQVKNAQRLALDQELTITQIEIAINEFLTKNLTNNGKPKKFLWWAVINIKSVMALVQTIIDIIKELKKKYESDTTGRS